MFKLTNNSVWKTQLFRPISYTVTMSKRGAVRFQKQRLARLKIRWAQEREERLALEANPVPEKILRFSQLESIPFDTPLPNSFYFLS